MLPYTNYNSVVIYPRTKNGVVWLSTIPRQVLDYSPYLYVYIQSTYHVIQDQLSKIFGRREQWARTGATSRLWNVTPLISRSRQNIRHQWIPKSQKKFPATYKSCRRPVELRPPKELTPQAWPIIALRPSVHQLLLHFYVILCTELLSSACI